MELLDNIHSQTFCSLHCLLNQPGNVQDRLETVWHSLLWQPIHKTISSSLLTVENVILQGSSVFWLIFDL